MHNGATEICHVSCNSEQERYDIILIYLFLTGPMVPGPGGFGVGVEGLTIFTRFLGAYKSLQACNVRVIIENNIQIVLNNQSKWILCELTFVALEILRDIVILLRPQVHAIFMMEQFHIEDL
ncbi:hypothetical protein ACJX0J_040776, partial [Zea mays]